jgi:hypothetical protein
LEEIGQQSSLTLTLAFSAMSLRRKNKRTSQTRQPQRANLSRQTNFVSKTKGKPSGELDHVDVKGVSEGWQPLELRKKRKKKLGPPATHLKAGITVSSENSYPFPSRPIVRRNKTQNTLPLNSGFRKKHGKHLEVLEDLNPK